MPSSALRARVSEELIYTAFFRLTELESLFHWWCSVLVYLLDLTVTPENRPE